MTMFDNAMSEINHLAATATGFRDNNLFFAARKLGMRSHYMTTDETDQCLAALAAACEANGLMKENRRLYQGKIKAHFREGFDNGGNLQKSNGAQRPTTWDWSKKRQEILGPEIDPISIKERVDNARALWEAGEPIRADYPAARYLANRGIKDADTTGRLLRQGILYDGTPWACYALMIVVLDSQGNFTGLQAVRITEDGHKIKDDWPAKVTRGLIVGNAAKITRQHSGLIYLVEGPEDGLSVAQTITDADVWVACGFSNMKNQISQATLTGKLPLAIIDEGIPEKQLEPFRLAGVRMKRIWRDFEGIEDINDALTKISHDELARWLRALPEPDNKFFVTAFEDVAAPDPLPALIEDILLEGIVGMIVGLPNVGKSFVAIYMGLCVATGRECFGKATKQTGVLYFALEGKQGIAHRLQGIKKEMQLEGQKVPFGHITEDINLADPASDDVEQIIKVIQSTETRFGQRIGLIFIDTMAKTITGYNENASDVMSLVAARCQQITDATGATVVAIHHPPKHGEGARGHSAITGNQDNRLVVKMEEDQIKGDKIGVVSTDKQRDMGYAPDIGFQLVKVDLGEDSSGKTFNTLVCVPRKDAGDTAPKKRMPRAGSGAELALFELMQMTDQEGYWAQPFGGTGPELKVVPMAKFRQRLKDAEITHNSKGTEKANVWARARKTLLKQGHIHIDGALVWLLDQPKRGLSDD